MDLRRRPVPAAAGPGPLAHGQARGALAHERLFDFTVSTDILPPVFKGLPSPLVTASDQEYRWSVLNPALSKDEFRPPFTVGEYWRLG